MRDVTDIDREVGFSLVEVLAALAIFSVAAIGMMRVTTENTSAVQRIETRALARIVADNKLAETLLSPGDLNGGELGGTEELAGRKWRWSRRVEDTPNPLVFRVVVTVVQIGPNESASSKRSGVDAEVSAYETRF